MGTCVPCIQNLLRVMCFLHCCCRHTVIDQVCLMLRHIIIHDDVRKVVVACSPSLLPGEITVASSTVSSSVSISTSLVAGRLPAVTRDMAPSTS